MVGSGNLTGDRAAHGSPHWRKAAVFPAEPGAEIARQLLERPASRWRCSTTARASSAPASPGASHLGVTIMVPADRLEEAVELLEDVLENFGGAAPESEDR